MYTNTHTHTLLIRVNPLHQRHLDDALTRRRRKKKTGRNRSGFILPPISAYLWICVFFCITQWGWLIEFTERMLVLVENVN